MLIGGQEAEHLVTEYFNLDNPDQVYQSLVQSSKILSLKRGQVYLVESTLTNTVPNMYYTLWQDAWPDSIWVLNLVNIWLTKKVEFKQQ